MKRPRAPAGDDLEATFAVEAPADAAGLLAEGAAAVYEAPPLSKRQRRKARAAAVAAAATAAAAATSGLDGSPAAAAPSQPLKRLPPGAASFTPDLTPSTAAAALWAAFTKSPHGATLTSLEYGAPLGAGNVVVHACVGALLGLPGGVKAVLPKWGALLGTRGAAAPRARGAPALLLLTHSAPRACDLIKALAPLGARVAKLFARHVALDDAAAALAGGPPVALAVGTPARVAALLERGALSLDSCAVVAVDAAPDKRGLCLLTEQEGRDAWWSLYIAFLHKKIIAANCKLALLF
jgi:hypothetical protein